MDTSEDAIKYLILCLPKEKQIGEMICLKKYLKRARNAKNAKIINGIYSNYPIQFNLIDNFSFLKIYTEIR